MKTQYLGFQSLSKDSLYPVRALRFWDDKEGNGELLSSRNVDSMETAQAMIRTFKAQFPRGKVQIEGTDFDILPATEANLAKLFKHPATFVSSL